jgi:hypothetical protein
LQKSVGEEQADSLRLLLMVGGHGAFVAAFRNRAEIALAHLSRQSRSPLRWRSRSARIRSADVAMVSPSVNRMVHENRSQGLNGPEALNGLAGSPSGHRPHSRGREPQCRVN